MKFNFASISIFISTLGSRSSQQAGCLEKEEKTTIARKECTNAGGYTSTRAKLVLDANWHWVNSALGHENGCTGNEGNSQCFFDPVQRAQNFVLEGASKDKCESAHGVHQIQDCVKVKFLT